MRKRFGAIVERGRLQTGKFGTNTGDTFGSFVVKHRSGRRFRVMVGDGLGWDHVSASTNTGRTPTWAEMCWLKDLFFDPDETVIQYHPAVSEYVNFHRGCLHLWRPQEEILPMPPIECV